MAKEMRGMRGITGERERKRERETHRKINKQEELWIRNKEECRQTRRVFSGIRISPRIISFHISQPLQHPEIFHVNYFIVCFLSRNI